MFLAVVVGLLTACYPSATAKSDFLQDKESQSVKNKTAFLQAEENIEKHRQGSVKLKIVRQSRKSPTKTEVKITQISHDFYFGCYFKIDDLPDEKLLEYQKNFVRVFNFATIGNYWDFVENEQFKENWAWYEKETELARKLNLKIGVAPILWGTNSFGTPKWLPKDKEKLLSTVEKRIEKSLTKSAEAIDNWELVNEPLASNPDYFAKHLGSEYLEKAFRHARKTNPEKRLMINEYGVFGHLEKHNHNHQKYFNLLRELLDKNVPLDIVGIQAHANGEWYEPADVAEKLNLYATLGKPLQITEFSSQILEYEDRQTPLEITGNYQKGFWNEEKQAEFYREFYTIAFGNPQVEAIITWGLDDQRGWLPGIGLIGENERLKPNYKMLDHLINKKWRTNLRISLLPNETADFRGFFGDYEVEVIENGKTTKKIFTLRKNGKNEWILSL